MSLERCDARLEAYIRSRKMMSSRYESIDAGVLGRAHASRACQDPTYVNLHMQVFTRNSKMEHICIERISSNMLQPRGLLLPYISRVLDETYVATRIGLRAGL